MYSVAYECKVVCVIYIRMYINITRPTLFLHPFITKQNNSEQTALILMKNIAYTAAPLFPYAPPSLLYFLSCFSSRVYKNYEIPCILELVKKKKMLKKKKGNIYFVGACETPQFPRHHHQKNSKIRV